MGMTGMNDGNVPVSSASKRKGRGDRGQSPEGRRKRASHACELCRVKKVKCDEQRPCSNCVRQNLECQYPGNPLLEIEIEAIKERLAQLEGRSALHQVADLALRSPVSVISRDDGTTTSPVIMAPPKLPPPIREEFSTTSPQIAPNSSSSDEADSLIEVNKDTQGEEYYGGSSSISILQRLYARARRQSGSKRTDGPQTHAPKPAQPSIVNLLHNPDFHAARATPPAEPVSYLLIEAGFLNVFFETLHYMHPVIDKQTFMQRCGQFTDVKGPLAALYYACIALSAITTPENDAKLGGYLPIQWANLYVDCATKALGDVYSITTLETVQALFLLSTVAQNALRPHDCYMYLGMALRSAVAIGMHQESSRVTDQPGRRRTWWAIYNLELELCCASGRPDSLPREEHIMVDLPHMETELPEVSMINVMVEYGRIARQVLGRMYLERRPLQEKLLAAREFDAALCNWRDSVAANLYHGPELQQPDYVERQKIVLELRFHHLRLLTHQHVLFVPIERSEQYRWHIDNCLAAASSTVHHLHHVFMDRRWFRSWWYNSTYCLFACMVLLYCILRNPHHPSISAVCRDVEMGLEVLEAMGGHRVARRCFELVSEVYELAKKVMEDKPAPQNITNLESDAIFPNLIDPFLLEEFAFHDDSTPGIHPPPWNADMDVDESNSTLETFLSFMASRCGEPEK